MKQQMKGLFIFSGAVILLISVCQQQAFAKTPAELCDEGNTGSCFTEASILFSQSKVKESLVYYEKACNGGHMDSCFFLGHRSKPDSAERKAALSKLKEYCDQNKYAACTHFGNVSMLDQDLKGLDALKLACQKGDVKGCTSLGYHAKKKGDMQTAKDAFNKACKRKNIQACRSLEKMGNTKSRDNLK